VSRSAPNVVLLLVGFVAPAAAQWHIGLELATHQYRGSSRDTTDSHVTPEGRPGGGIAFGLRLTKDWGRTGTTLRVTYATTGFAIAGSGLTVTDKTTGTLLETAMLISTRVGGIGPSGAIRVELGPALHLWDFDGEYRTRFGGIGAAAYEWPVSKRFTGAVRLEGMVSPSWFETTELPPEFERQLTWRYGFALGLRYRL
jgi:hypothetical protein